MYHQVTEMGGGGGLKIQVESKQYQK
jgi:hypothetical protein